MCGVEDSGLGFRARFSSLGPTWNPLIEEKAPVKGAILYRKYTGIIFGFSGSSCTCGQHSSSLVVGYRV